MILGLEGRPAVAALVWSLLCRVGMEFLHVLDEFVLGQESFAAQRAPEVARMLLHVAHVIVKLRVALEAEILQVLDVNLVDLAEMLRCCLPRRIFLLASHRRAVVHVLLAFRAQHAVAVELQMHFEAAEGFEISAALAALQTRRVQILQLETFEGSCVSLLMNFL